MFDVGDGEVCSITESCRRQKHQKLSVNTIIKFVDVSAFHNF